MATTATNKDGSQRKTRSAPKSSRKTSHRLAAMTDAEIISQIAAYIQRTAADGAPMGIARYERERPAELPSMTTLRVTRGITWNQCIEAAGFTPREQIGGKKRTRQAPAAQRQRPEPAEYVARPQIVTGRGYRRNCKHLQCAHRQPGRPLDPAPVDYAGLPEPQRDPVTGRLPAVLDCNGRPWPRVIVYPGERTCKRCSETFVTRRQAVKLGRDHGGRWEEREIGFCPRCGIDEQGNARKLPTPPPSVATADYLAPGEYQKA